ncbi:MAG: hypothetical protein ACRYG4_18890 [Janthinobacterium lividum]
MLEVALGAAIVALPVEPRVPTELVVPIDPVLLEPLLESVPIEPVPADEPPDDDPIWADAAVAINAAPAASAIKVFIVYLLGCPRATNCGAGLVVGVIVGISLFVGCAVRSAAVRRTIKAGNKVRRDTLATVAGGTDRQY